VLTSGFVSTEDCCVDWLVDICDKLETWKLDNLVTRLDPVMRLSSGLKIGRLAQTILMPACTVVQTSVLEYDGTLLPLGYPRITLTSPVMIVL
jgi:hypothetical protein